MREGRDNGGFHFLRRRERRKTREGCAVATDEELGEIPLDPSAEHAGQRLFQITKQRVWRGR